MFEIKITNINVLGNSLYHCTSTDSKPNHIIYPSGESSWCFYNKTLPKKETPKPHKEMVHKTINALCLAKMIPVYQRLASNAILKDVPGENSKFKWEFA